ncbi:CopD family protein [Gordonia hydrophobica]|uniref:CopD family protein n=1 Tax=Gordonia hydrophobica TaxID=40516 RepID=A0ABZ2U6Q3_9ACTN|nr:CopD family protein [Gordonia hydrophobica]MBM7367527.1 putative copper resistance protein D [Gordonia hydrophobica]
MAGPSDVARLRVRLLCAAALLAAVGVGVGEFLARPEPSSWAGVAVLVALCLLLGLGALPLIGTVPAAGWIAVAAGVWGAASLVGVWLQVAERSGQSVLEVGLGDLVDGIETGLPVVVGVLGSLAVLAWCFAAMRGDPPVLIVAVVAALGVLAVSVTGHGTESVWIPVVLGVHALCAAWWAGTIGALIVTVRGKRGWAATLPEFSRRALPAVAALTVTGVVAAVAQIGVGPQLWETGYGRLLLAKAVLLAVLLGLAARHRRSWVPRAARHGASERESILRAGTELLVLTVVLGLAAGLATTGTV